jgi:exodeoxyribonuclease V alpha subunit
MTSQTKTPVEAEGYFHPLLLQSQHLTGADYLLASEELADDDRQLLRILLALALRCPEDGHSYLDLGEMERFRLSEEERKQSPELPSYPADFWVALARKVPRVIGLASSSVVTPLVLDDDRLYLAKLYGDEQEIASIIRERWSMGEVSKEADSVGDPSLFVLLGGPGAGKTSTIAVRLIKFINSFSGEPKVSMAAPTGKAALRMKSACERSLELLGSGKYVWPSGKPEVSPEDVAKARPQVNAVEAFTIHKLLAFNPANTRSRWGLGRDRRLDCDLLIIDECSMISLELLAHLLRAVPKTAQIWFVGDPNQLASVGVGSVLADIEAAHARLWPTAGSSKESGSPRLTVLTSNFRQQNLSRGKRNPVADLVSAIRESATDLGAKCLEVLDAATGPSSAEVQWIDPSRQAEEFKALLEQLRAEAMQRCAIGESEDAVKKMQDALSNDGGPDFKQVLCVHRHGDFGVSGMNTYITNGLNLRSRKLWYPGRPVLVTKNDNSKRDAKEKMWNGDTGVVVTDGQSLKLVLSEPAGRAPQPVARLNEHETCYAMTVHKSQGSEYNEVVVMLPMKPSRICTREMLYTAVSRAKKKVTIVGPRDVVEHMLKTPVHRASWLGERV